MSQNQQESLNTLSNVDEGKSKESSTFNYNPIEGTPFWYRGDENQIEILMGNYILMRILPEQLDELKEQIEAKPFFWQMIIGAMHVVKSITIED